MFFCMFLYLRTIYFHFSLSLSLSLSIYIYIYIYIWGLRFCRTDKVFLDLQKGYNKPVEILNVVIVFHQNDNAATHHIKRRVSRTNLINGIFDGISVLNASVLIIFLAYVVLVCLSICLCSICPARMGCDTRPIFKGATAGLNSQPFIHVYIYIYIYIY